MRTKIKQLVATGVLSGGLTTAMKLRKNLVAYWNLDEVSNGTGAVSRADSTTGAHTLTDVGTTASATGIKTNAPTFVITDKTQLVAAHHADFNIGTANWEMVAWVNVNDTSLQQIITKNSTQRGSEFVLQMDNTTHKFQWAVRNTSNAWVIVTATTLGVPTPGAWYMIDVYHDAAAHKIGIACNNGAFDLLAFDTNGSLGTATAKVCLSGNDNDTPSIFLGGSVDEVGIWKGRLLTAAERTKLYNGGAANTYPFA